MKKPKKNENFDMGQYGYRKDQVLKIDKELIEEVLKTLEVIYEQEIIVAKKSTKQVWVQLDKDGKYQATQDGVPLPGTFKEEEEFGLHPITLPEPNPLDILRNERKEYITREGALMGIIYKSLLPYKEKAEIPAELFMSLKEKLVLLSREFQRLGVEKDAIFKDDLLDDDKLKEFFSGKIFTQTIVTPQSEQFLKLGMMLESQHYENCLKGIAVKAI